MRVKLQTPVQHLHAFRNEIAFKFQAAAVPLDDQVIDLIDQMIGVKIVHSGLIAKLCLMRIFMLTMYVARLCLIHHDRITGLDAAQRRWSRHRSGIIRKLILRMLLGLLQDRIR